MAQRYQGGILGVGFNPLQAPNAPTIGAATAGSAQVSVAFTAPTNVGGSAVSSYAVRVSPGNFSASGSSSPITVSGLTNGTTYTFSIAALNSYGPSPYSGTVTATPAAPAIEDVFSTWLYTGNGGTQTITNGINLSGQGGLVWIKNRGAVVDHLLFWQPTLSPWLSSNTASASGTLGSGNEFTSSGFSLNASSSLLNASANTYASWTFRKATNFFDVVTYTGTGTARTVAHNLGSVPGCIIVKRTNTTSDWQVYHQSTAAGMGPNKYMVLNSTATEATGSDRWNNTAPTSSVFSVGNAPETNASGATYVAYLFAHDTSSGGLIQCGSYAGSGAAGNTVTLGWEPQWIMIKASTTAQSWWVYDTMRGMPVGSDDAVLVANSAGAEQTYEAVSPTATGFQLMNGNPDTNAGSQNYIYIAIRRGPMKIPTVGTSVFSPISRTGTSGNVTVSTSFVPDFVLTKALSGTYAQYWWNGVDRLRGVLRGLFPNIAWAESTVANGLTTLSVNSFSLGSDANYNDSSSSYINYAFGRAPSFFDEVCYTGTGSGARTLNHNLTVSPELMILKTRSSDPGYEDWFVYSNSIPATSNLTLNSNVAAGSVTNVINTPTATTFGVLGIGNRTNVNYVSYLFATCPGVSKVGSYTGTGSLQTINCGFTTGARFVMIKRTDDIGNWYVWDSARGISSGNDPYSLINSANGQVTGTNYVDTDTTGFKVTAAAPADINAGGGTYIFLAIS